MRKKPSPLHPKYPHINPDRDRIRRFYLCESVDIELTNGEVLHIPAGYRFDGHSIPGGWLWLFLFVVTSMMGFTALAIFCLAVACIRAFFPVYDMDVYAALVHDYLIDYSHSHRHKRKFIDEQYWEIMNHPGYLASPLRRAIFPRAVKYFGFFTKTLWGQ